MALHGLFSFLIGTLQLGSESGHLVLKQVHLFDYLPLLLVGF